MELAFRVINLEAILYRGLFLALFGVVCANTRRFESLHGHRGNSKNERTLVFFFVGMK